MHTHTLTLKLTPNFRLEASIRSPDRTLDLTEEEAWRLLWSMEEEIENIMEGRKLFSSSSDQTESLHSFSIAQAEQVQIKRALRYYETYAEAAEALGITRRTLLAKRENYGINIPKK